MAPYTKLAVRSLGPTKAVTREEHAKLDAELAAAAGSLRETPK